MIRTALALVLLAGPATALTLDLPGNAMSTADEARSGAGRLAVGPETDGRVPVKEFPGQVSLRAWSAPGQATTFQLLDPLRRQLDAAGFHVLVDCAGSDCGGFDFRFAIRVLPEPGMHVDLGDFRYYAAEKPGPEGAQAVAILVSRSASAGYLQIETVVPGPAAPADAAPLRPADLGAAAADTPPPDAADAAPFVAGSLASQLERSGHAVLDDLTFDSGSTRLGAGPYASLQELAGYLQAHPGRTVVLVGHSDTTGGLTPNIQLSRRRAASVAERLVATYGVPPAQISAEGVGYLAPRASNLTEAGRTLNRRVEAVLTGSE
jgi:OOP family OmpA-OmpF porin